MKSPFDLPDYWVYVYFENGTKENVANTDTLDPDEADKFKEMWEKPNRKVIAVALEDGHGKVLHIYKYNGKIKRKDAKRKNLTIRL